MEITQLRYFIEVAQSEHITKSAEKLHIAQPALTQAIKRLEDELGVPLFVKDGRNIVITDYGKYLKEKVTPFINMLNEIPTELSEMKNIKNRTVSINVMAASSFVTNAVIKFQAMHDDIKIKLMQNSEDKSCDIDIATRLFYQHSDEADTHCFVCTEQIFLAVPSTGKYADVDSVSLSEIENEGFISLMGSRQFRNICDKFCHRANIRPNYIFESDSPTAVQNMIAANLGVGFWPEFSWGKLRNNKVKQISISDINCSRDLIFTLNKSCKNQAAIEFFEYLRKTMK